ncbi:MAG: HAMP domain-containing histidine kinase [Anaerolineae bacterium]|nr:HAMP domain-containing histidine kinase [Anaerolineae bacterium]
MRASVRWRLALSYLLLTILVAGLVSGLGLFLVNRYVRAEELQRLTSNAQAVAERAAPLLGTALQREQLQELAQTASFLSDARVRILDATGDAIADSDAGASRYWWVLSSVELETELPSEGRWTPVLVLPGGRHDDAMHTWRLTRSLPRTLPPEAAEMLLRWRSGTWGGSLEIEREQVADRLRESETIGPEVVRSNRVVTVPIGDQADPDGYVEVSEAVDLSTGVVRTVGRALLLATGGAALVAVGAGLLVSRGLTSPLRELAAVAEAMGAGNLGARAAIARRDEIGQLGRRFNDMAERLEASFAQVATERDALKRFVADASHELRTPITALRNFHDVLLGPAEGDPIARREFLVESQAQVARLERITRNLLDLSRFDAGLVALDLDAHDAGDVIASAVSGLGVLAREKGIALVVKRPDAPVVVHCDRARIEVALSNLLDNAIKFTPPGGQVEIGAEAAPGGMRLWVSDDGCGIDPGELPRIFERFYRGQDARQEGSGLGLSIVESIVRAHGGWVSVESSPGKGSVFTVVLPAPPGDARDPGQQQA